MNEITYPTESQLAVLAAIARAATGQWEIITEPDAQACLAAGWVARSKSRRYVLTNSGREALRNSASPFGMAS